MIFQIDFAAMVSTLPVMLWGMIGGMVVMGAICLVIVGLYRIGKGKRKNNHPA